jgi:hypothetical protein
MTAMPRGAGSDRRNRGGYPRFDGWRIMFRYNLMPFSDVHHGVNQSFDADR